MKNKNRHHKYDEPGLKGIPAVQMVVILALSIVV